MTEQAIEVEVPRGELESNKPRFNILYLSPANGKLVRRGFNEFGEVIFYLRNMTREVRENTIQAWEVTLG